MPQLKNSLTASKSTARLARNQSEGERQMKHIHAHEFLEMQDFVTDAKLHFENNPDHKSYTVAEISSGCLFAMRWGMDEDSILVFRVSEDMEPLVIGNIIGSN